MSGCMQALRREFRWRNLGFAGVRAERFCTSQWRMPLLVYLFYRVCIMMYVVIWLGLSLKKKPDKAWVLYLTNWTYVLLALYVSWHFIAVIIFCTMSLICGGRSSRGILQCGRPGVGFHRSLFTELDAGVYEEIVDDGDERRRLLGDPRRDGDTAERRGLLGGSGTGERNNQAVRYVVVSSRGSREGEDTGPTLVVSPDSYDENETEPENKTGNKQVVSLPSALADKREQMEERQPVLKGHPDASAVTTYTDPENLRSKREQIKRKQLFNRHADASASYTDRDSDIEDNLNGKPEKNQVVCQERQPLLNGHTGISASYTDPENLHAKQEQMEQKHPLMNVHAGASTSYTDPENAHSAPKTNGFVPTPNNSTFVSRPNKNSFVSKPCNNSFVSRYNTNSFLSRPNNNSFVSRPRNNSFVSKPGFVGAESSYRARHEYETTIGNNIDPPSRPPWYLCVVWILYSAVSTGALLVTTVYFILLYPRTGQYPSIAVQNLQVHALNSCVILLEHFLSAVPCRLLHLVYPILYGIIYLLFTVVYWKIDKDYVIYPFLDWNKPGPTLGFVLVLAVIVFPLLHCFYFLIYKARMAIYRRL